MTHREYILLKVSSIKLAFKVFLINWTFFSAETYEGGHDWKTTSFPNVDEFCSSDSDDHLLIVSPWDHSPKQPAARQKLATLTVWMRPYGVTIFAFCLCKTGELVSLQYCIASGPIYKAQRNGTLSIYKQNKQLNLNQNCRKRVVLASFASSGAPFSRSY